VNAKRRTSRSAKHNAKRSANEHAIAYRTPEAAEVAGVSIRVLQRWIASGELASIRISRIRLVRRQALEAFLTSRESSS
jgi:excisionase family DNA binding protein